MSLNARVLIVARDDAVAQSLALDLDRSGWRSITARGVHAASLALADLPIEAAIVVSERGAEADARDVGRRLKTLRMPGRFPILGLGLPGEDGADHDAFDLVLAPPLDTIQAARRLEQLVRAGVAEEEVELRQQTFTERGGRLERPRLDTTPIKVLTIGEPAPKFLGLSHALKRRGAEVVGAFTAYTAFDYLHDRAFDAVVLWGGETTGEALSIATGMRRNSRLYHLPALLYMRASRDLDVAEAFRRGLSDVAAADTSEDETALRVIALASTYRREGAIRRALERARGSGLMDSATGLFTRELFAAHLGRLAEACRLARRPLSVAILRLAERPRTQRARAGGWLDRAMPQIGAMVGRLVRAEDTAARIAPEVFALALPGTDLGAAQAAAERIAAVIACTAFEAGGGEASFTAEFDVGAAELQPGESVIDAFRRAAAVEPARQAG